MKLSNSSSPAQGLNLSAGFSLALIVCALVSLCSASLPAQTVTFTGAKPSVDVGSANLCKPGLTKPAPCATTVTLDYKVSAGGTLGTPKVLTQGYPDLDFTLANGTTCSGGVTAGEICAVNVSFAPRFPGTREGGVLIVDDNGNVLATTYLYGTGIGPQLDFTPGVDIFNEDISASFGKAVNDGEGNTLVLVSFENPPYLLKVPPDGGPTTKISLVQYADLAPTSVAIDGVGNLYLLGAGIAELPVGGGPNTLPGYLSAYFEDGFNISSADKFGNLLLFANNPLGGYPPPAEAILPPTPDRTPATIINTFPVDAYGFGVTFEASDAAGNLVNDVNTGAATELFEEFPAGSTVGATLPFNSTPEAAAFDPVGNIYAGVYIAGIQFGLVELPLGRGPQVSVPIPSSSQGNFLRDGPDIFAGANGNLLGNESVLIRSVASPLNFGSVPVGSAKTLPIGITNTGNRPLVLSPFYKSSSYEITDSPCDCLKSIAPGGNCTLNVRFTALSKGDHTILLTLGSNGTADANILLEGTGTE